MITCSKFYLKVTSEMKKRTVGLISGFWLLSIVSMANANLIDNGDFEQNGGSLEEWNYSGSVTVAEGGILGLQGMTDNYALLGGWDTGGTQKLSQEFSVSSIQEITISFDWAFDSIDYSHFNDDTFLAIAKQDDSRDYKIKMLDLTSSESGTFFWDIDAAYGSYEQTFSIADWTDVNGEIKFKLSEAYSWCTDSIVGIDNVVITGAPAPVPEPSTIFFVGVGMAGFVGSRIRRKVRKVSK